MRRSTRFLIFLGLNLLLLTGLLIHAAMMRERAAAGLEAKRELVRSLDLTDLCLFTEAAYTRHLSQADLHTPFQDGPSVMEHFPSGGLVAPPQTLRSEPVKSRTHENLD